MRDIESKIHSMLANLKQTVDRQSELVGSLLTEVELDQVTGGGTVHTMSGGSYTQTGGRFTQSTGSYDQSGGIVTMGAEYGGGT